MDANEYRVRELAAQGQERVMRRYEQGGAEQLSHTELIMCVDYLYGKLDAATRRIERMKGEISWRDYPEQMGR